MGERTTHYWSAPRLFAWQSEALEAWRAQQSRGIVEAVTGTGKTRVGLEAIREALDEGRRAAVLVPTRALRKQWHGELRRELPGSVRIGTLGDGGSDTLDTHDVVVAVVNAAATKELTSKSGHLLVADECHRYAAPMFRKALLERFELRLGLTATLERPDRQEFVLEKYFGGVCFRIGYGRALGDEVVAHYSLALIGVPMTPTEHERYEELSKEMAEGIRELSEEHGIPLEPFHRFLRAVTELAEDPRAPGCQTARRFLSTTQQRKQLMANSSAKRAAVGALAPALSKSERALVFTETQQSADDLAGLLRERGVHARAVHGNLDDGDPLRLLSDFKRGTIHAVVAVKILNEGVDVPEVDLGVIVAASRTRRDMIQRMGRVLRRKQDDRLARFAIVYLEGTSEDPARGGHEAFLADVTGFADDMETFRVADVDDAIAFLAIDTPVSTPQPRRFVGDPPRAEYLRVPPAAPDDDRPARTVYGL